MSTLLRVFQTVNKMWTYLTFIYVYLNKYTKGGVSQALT